MHLSQVEPLHIILQDRMISVSSKLDSVNSLRSITTPKAFACVLLDLLPFLVLNHATTFPPDTYCHWCALALAHQIRQVLCQQSNLAAGADVYWHFLLYCDELATCDAWSSRELECPSGMQSINRFKLIIAGLRHKAIYLVLDISSKVPRTSFI